MTQRLQQQPAGRRACSRKARGGGRLCALAGLMITAGMVAGGMTPSPAHAAADQSLTLTESVTAVTCDVSVPATLALDNMNVGAVTGTQPDKSTGKTFSVTLNCQGGAAPQASVVGVWGTPDAAGSYTKLFRNEDVSAGAAKGVGFVLTNSTDGSGTLLVAAGSQAVATTVPAGIAGESLNNKTIPFFIMPYRGGYGVTAVKAGTMKATLNFDFQWK
ncbi:fimbrial protein [Enterobacter ludwigii]